MFYYHNFLLFITVGYMLAQQSEIVSAHLCLCHKAECGCCDLLILSWCVFHNFA